MPIAIICSGCQKTYRVKDELAGRRVKCPGCSSPIQVPADRTVPQPEAKLPAARAAGRTAPAASQGGGKPTAPAIAKAPAVARVSGSSFNSKPNPKEKPALTRQQVLAQVLAGFKGELPARRASPLYFIGVLFTTAIMIALPLIYIGLIGSVCWAVYWHMINDTGIITAVHEARVVVFLFVAYLAPLVIGAILIVFMIKPLFARPANIERRRTIKRQGEPVLFALVDKVCEIVNAPIPKRIDINCDVNASAGMRRGLLSVIVGNVLVLTIGLPLAAGLNVEQFAGVLAHEFGHFSQGVGMRLTYIVRSINFWFLRTIFQRDSWDVWLPNAHTGLDFRIAWILLAARGCVWLTRKVLWALMMLGNVVAGFMLRQMEFDADSYQTWRPAQTH